MVFGLFKKYCPICGMEVGKEKAIIRFGKYLCSDEHAEEYRQKLAKEQASATKKGGGGCC